MMEAKPDADFNGSLCRDCLTWLPKGPQQGLQRCTSCGGPRLLAHSELLRLHIAHIDCDAFYAAIEKRDNPELADKPVIVGGGRRGVVSTCCYIARIYGVRSAMPMFKALDACPDAVVIKPNMEKYIAVGKDIRERMRALTPLVEPLSIDEAFLDLNGTERLHQRPTSETLARFAKSIEDEIGITVSVGLSHNKFLAKIASDLEKPRGFSVIGKCETVAFLAKQNVSLIFGVGKTFAAKLQSDGFRTIGDLQRAEPAELAKRYGASGLRLAKLSKGEDTRDVTPSRDAKSISAERTFNEDIHDFQELRRILRKVAEKVSVRAKASELAGYRVTLKLKTADFKTITRAHTLSDPTNLSDRIFRTADEMLEELCNGTRYRLLGVGISELTDALLADPDDLLDEGATKRAKAERAIDLLRERMGEAPVETGLTFDPNRSSQS